MDVRVREDIIDKTSVNNEVLGNVLRGLLYSLNDEDIFNTIDNCFSNDEVYEARKILVKLFFDLFENEEPNGRYMGPKERELKKDEHVMDIIEKMNIIARMEHDVEFCIPWNYNYVVVSDEEKRFKEMVRQKDLEIDMKFQSLEKVIDKKNREMITAVKNIIEQVGSVEKEGEIYIHSSDSEDAASLKGAAGLGLGLGNFVYKRRQIDVQILNSLIIFVIAIFAVKFIINILSIFSVNI